MTRSNQALLSLTPPGTGYDWVVHYRVSDELALLPVFDRETMAEVLDEACYWLDGEHGDGLGTYEITGIVRRDMIGNADEMLGPGRPN